MAAVTVLICDDHAGFRTSLATLLSGDADIEVVGEAADGAAAEEAAGLLQPAVVLMDLTMPGVGGIEATHRIVTNAPHIGVIVLTMVEDDDSVFAAMRAGAHGYLLKGARKAEIMHAIKGVAAGEAIFGPPIAARMINYFTVSRPPSQATAFPELTARETDILSLMATHLTNPSIGHRLGISEKTVRNNVSAILVKLRVADRAQAILAAREAGLGTHPLPSPGLDHHPPRGDNDQ
jgi:DNA-binding NarL/FixJ family response regulator